MDHATVMRKAIAESYVLDQLSEQERAEFEAHFFTCPECAEDVKTLTLFVEDTRKVLGKSAAGRRATGARQRLRWLMLPLAATAVLSLGAAIYQTAVTVPQLRRDLARSQAVQATSLKFLSVARSDPAEIRVGAQQNTIALNLSLSGYGSLARYRIDVRDAEGALVIPSAIVPAPAAGEELALLLPISDLGAGRYAVELSGIDATEERTTPLEVTRYPFILTREEK